MRLIDAEQLVMHLSDYALQESPGWGSDDWGNKDAYDAISNCILAVQEAPTVDAVEVVMCKDCRFFKGDGLECHHSGMFAYEDDYCSNGERRGADEH